MGYTAMKPGGLTQHTLGLPVTGRVISTSNFSFHRDGAPRSLLLRGRCRHSRAAVANPNSAAFTDEDAACASNLGEYCSLGPDARPQALSLGEKERLYVEAAAAVSLGKKALLTDAEYDNLKEELTWQGSQVTFLTETELQFLAALRMQSAEFKPLRDEEFDALEAKLRKEGSQLASWGPRCSLELKTMFTDAVEDESLANLLKLSVTAALLAVLWGGKVVTNGSWGTVAEMAALVMAYGVANLVVGSALRDSLVLKATCPQCGAQNQCVLGKAPILAQGEDTALVTCQECAAQLKFEAESRKVTVAPEGSSRD